MSGALFDVDRDDMSRTAVISECGTYRYQLTRQWVPGLETRRVTWIMLNPSIADARIDDPTIRRCIGFAKAWGYGGIVVRNLYALRATDPRELWRHPDPIGPENDDYLISPMLNCHDLVVCAWGAHGKRGPEVRERLALAGARPHYLALTKDGQPRHPLYLKGDLTPIPWEAS